MNLSERQYLSAAILAGCSTLSLMTACHFRRHYNLLLDRLKAETYLSNHFNTLLARQNLNSVNLRVTYDQMGEQVELIKKMITEKRIRIDEMKSLVQDCDRVHQGEQPTTILCNRIEKCLAVTSEEKTINLLPQQQTNNITQIPMSSFPANQVTVSQIINFFEQKL